MRVYLLGFSDCKKMLLEKCICYLIQISETVSFTPLI